MSLQIPSKRPPLDFFYDAYAAIARDDADSVSQGLINLLTVDCPTIDRGTGMAYFPQLVPALLDLGWYAEVGAMLWGSSLFSVEPQSVRKIWSAINQSSTLLVMGAGSMGKSYSIAAWSILDWIRDPAQTCFKIVSLTREHAKRNVFASMMMFHGASIIPLPGDRQATSIQVDENDKQGIHLEALRQGENGRGKLQGFHPHPRRFMHRQFKMTRVRIVVDEAEEAPEGVWYDIDNFLTSKFDDEHVKVIAATNPRREASLFGQRAQPSIGWSALDLDKHESWSTPLGWNVLRLDGIKCENVAKRKLVFPGLLTCEGFDRYIALGKNHPDYWTMGRGAYPPKGVSMAILPSFLYERAQGELSFKGTITPVAAADLAFEGDDDVAVALGRFGTAIGWTPAFSNEFIAFEEPKQAIQLDAVFTFPKGRDTLEVSEDILKFLVDADVLPLWFACDRTGNGTGVHDVLRARYGQDLLGIHYGEAATKVKLFEEDTETSYDKYDGVNTEMAFVAKRLIEFDALKFGSGVPLEEMKLEATDRLYTHVKKKQAIESKADFKARHRKSPDRYDAVTMLSHLVVQGRNSKFAENSMTRPDERVQVSKKKMRMGHVDKLTFTDFSKD